MAVVGSAEVIVRAITSQVKRDIEKAFRDARANIKAEGAAAGRDWAEGFANSIRTGNVSDALSESLSNSGVTDAAKTAGRSAGDSFNDSVKQSVGGLDISPEIDSTMGEGATDAARLAAQKAGDELESGMRDAGGRGGRGFRDGFLSSGFQNAAISASQSFTTLLVSSSLLGPAISALVSSLSALVAGLASMALAAGQAVGALAVLPGAMSVAAQAAGALKLAFSGVGDAISAGVKWQQAADTANVSNTATTYAVVDAQKALQKARQGAADAAFDAAQRVRLAEAGVRSAQMEVLNVQRQLNDARREAAESLQQMAFSAEDAALGEERAALTLEDARARLEAAQQLPPDNRARREAELAYKEAELAFRQAKDRNSDMEKEQKRAAKAGIKGSDEVLAVREQINAAQERLAGAEKQLADARLAQDRQARDSAQAVADAAERLRRAQEETNQALKGGSTQAKAYKAALNALGRPAANFVRYIVSIQDEIKKLKVAAGKNLFPGLQSGLESIVENLFPVLQTQLGNTGGLLGDMAEQFGIAISTGEGLSRIRNIMSDNNEILEEFNKKGANGRTTIQQLADVALRLLDAIQPITRRFAIWVRGLVDIADASTDTKKEMSGLRDFFERAGDTAAQLGRIFGNLFEALGIISDGSKKAGQGLLDSFEGATENLVTFLDELRNNGSMQEFFEKAANNLRAIGRLVNVVGEEFFGLADNSGVAGFADGMIPVVRRIGSIIDKLTTASPAVAKFAEQAAILVDNLTNSGATEMFVNTLTKIVEIINKVIGTEFGQKVLLWAGMIAAFTRPISFALRIAGFFFKALIGGPLSVIKSFSRMFSFVGRIGRAFSGIRNNGLKSAFSGIKKGSDSAKDALEKQMITDKAKTEVLEKLERQAKETASALRKVQKEGAPAAGATSKAKKAGKAAASGAGAAALGGGVAGDEFAKQTSKNMDVADKATRRSTGRMRGALGKLASPFKATGKAVGGVGKGFKVLGGGLLGIVGGPFGLLLTFLPQIIKLFMAIVKRSPALRAFFVSIGKIVTKFAAFVREAFFKWVVPAIDSLFKKVNAVLPSIIKWFSDLFSKIRGFIVNDFLPVWRNVLWPAITGFSKNVVVPAVKIAKNIIVGFFKVIKFLITKVFVPVWKNVLWPLIKGLWKIFQKYVQLVINFWKTAFKIMKGVWTNVLKPVIEAIVKAFQSIRDKVSDVVKGVKAKWSEFTDGIAKLRDKIGGIVDKIKGFFASIPDAVTNAFSNLKNAGKNSLNFWIDQINKLIKGANKLPGIEIPVIERMAKGGRVRGQGGATQDNHLRLLSAGEFVIRNQAARSLGYQLLAYLNRYGKLPFGRVAQLATGGTVSATPGGILSLLGEGGRNERVSPLDRDGLSARDRAIIGLLLEQFQDRGETWQVYPAPGMSEIELAKKVRNEVRFSRRRGA